MVSLNAADLCRITGVQIISAKAGKCEDFSINLSDLFWGKESQRSREEKWCVSGYSAHHWCSQVSSVLFAAPAPWIQRGQPQPWGVRLETAVPPTSPGGPWLWLILLEDTLLPTPVNEQIIHLRSQAPPTTQLCLHPPTGEVRSKPRASLVAQWLRSRLPIRGIRVQALVREDPTCREATKPVRHNYWACAPRPRAPQQEKPRQWEARTPNEE